LQDELVLAAIERYRGEQPRAAEFLHTPSRNIGRWLPKIRERDNQRHACESWRDASRLVRDWVRALPATADSPIESLERLLISHIERLNDTVTAKEKASMLGVSAPTYQKRVRDYEALLQNEEKTTGSQD